MRLEKGFTLVELMSAFAISAIMFGAILTAFLTVKSVNSVAGHRIQALQIVKGQIEHLKITAFDEILASTSTVSYDAGRDAAFNTADDWQGTLTVALKDGMDMDSDSNTTETAIDVNGDGVNDQVDAKPLRVTFTWTEKVFGSRKTFSVFADTLISA